MSKTIKVQDDVYDAICKYGEGKVGAGIKKLLELADKPSDKEITIQYNEPEAGKMSNDPYFDGWERTQTLEEAEWGADGPVCLERINDNVYGFIKFGHPCACVYKKREDY